MNGSRFSGITSKEIIQIPFGKDFLNALHDVEHTRESHAISPHLVLRRVLVRNQRTPVFLKPLKGRTLGRGELSSQIDDFAAFRLCWNKEGLVIVAGERCALIFLYQSTLPPPLQPERIFKVYGISAQGR